MYRSTERIAASNKAGTEFAITIAHLQVAAFERFSALTFNAMKTLVEDCLEQTKTRLAARDSNELINLNCAAAQPSIENSIAYSRSMYDVALQTHGEITKVMEAHAAALTTSILEYLDKSSISPAPGSGVAAAAVKSALAAAGSTYESLSKISKQTTELTEAGFTAAIQGVRGHRNTTA